MVDKVLLEIFNLFDLLLYWKLPLWLDLALKLLESDPVVFVYFSEVKCFDVFVKPLVNDQRPCLDILASLFPKRLS